MATLAKALRYKPVNGASAFVGTFGEAASQSFVKDEFVKLSSGLVARIVATSTELASGDKILGRALEAASGTTSDPVQVLLATNGILYELPASADTSTQATAVAQLGTSYGLIHLATAGIYAYNVSETTDVKVVPIEFPSLLGSTTVPYPASGAGETSGTAMCAVLPAARALPL